MTDIGPGDIVVCADADKLALTSRRPGKDLGAVRLSIPYPPTANNLFRNLGGGRVKTERYKTWLRAAGNELLAQKREQFTGPVIVALTVVRPDKRKRDLDNLIKGPLDLLVDQKIISDDSEVVKITAEWGDETVIEVCAAT
jgi:crossover junction endodeoxyribonuclease RusA